MKANRNATGSKQNDTQTTNTHTGEKVPDDDRAQQGDAVRDTQHAAGHTQQADQHDAEDAKQAIIDDISELFVKNITDNMTAFGATSSIGRVLGTIYMNGAPMTLDDLSRETGMSKTRMSQVTRDMDAMNLAERTFKKGVRKDLYQVEQDYYQTFISVFTSTWQKATNRGRHFEADVKHKLADLNDEPDLTPDDEHYIERIEAERQVWSAYHDWIRRVTEFFDSGEIFKHVPKQPNTGGNTNE